MEIKINDYVIVNENATGLKGYAEFARVNKLPVLVYSVDVLQSGFYTKDLSINNFAQNPFVLTNELVTKITLQEKEKLEKIINKEFLKQSKELIKELDIKRIPINNRKEYSIDKRVLLDTRGNYVNQYPQGTLIKNNYDVKTPGKLEHTPGVICCSFSRSTRDMLVYIPKSWLKYFGYNLVDVKSWFKFLEKCEINFKGKILGTKTLRQVFGSQKISNNKKITAKLNNIYQNIDEDCIEVFINGDPIHIRQTYFRFIVTRFLYSSKYWNIPTIAMKLKKNIPSLTNWECLLVAHCTENYDGYYSLTDNTHGNLAIPSKYNSAENIFKILANPNCQVGMNRSFKKYNKNTIELRNAIITEDFKMIEKIVKEYRDVN